jgi:TonB family protein
MDCPGKRTYRLRREGVRLVQASALMVVVALALQGRAEERAIKSRVAPVYPEIAKRMRVTGVVKLEVTVDAAGKVTDVKTVSGNRTLSTAAEEAVRKWQFVPGPEPSTISLNINFDLNQ